MSAAFNGSELLRVEGGVSIIGHRGSGSGTTLTPGGDVQENTVSSFVAAVDAGVDWIETDLVRTVDDYLVLYHDPVLPDGRAIERTRREDLPEHIPNFAEALAAIPANIGFVAEVKGVLRDGSVRTVHTTETLAASAFHAEHEVRPRRKIISYGFEPGFPYAFRSEAKIQIPNVSLGVIAEGGSSVALMTLAAIRDGSSIVSAHTTSLLGERAEKQALPDSIADVIEFGHQQGIGYVCWCPSTEQIDSLIELGVDAMCVNIDKQMRQKILDVKGQRWKS